MNIGAMIKDLRRQNDMTQEQLAEHLGVSVSAISQWESGKTMPDISLLPPIANLFGVSADTLLGINVHQIQAKVEQHKREYDVLYKERRYAEMLEAARRINKEIPNNPELMGSLAFALTIGEYAAEKENIDEAIRLYKLILEKSVDNVLRFRASANLCRLYAEKKKDREQARFYAQQLPKTYLHTSSYLMSFFHLFEDEEKEQNFKWQIEGYTTVLADAIFDLADPNCKNSKCRYTVSEKIEILQKELELLRLIYGDDLLSVNRECYDVTRTIGCLWLVENEPEKALDSFEAAAEYAIACDAYMDGAKYSSLLLADVETNDHAWCNTAAEDLLNRFTNQDRYDVLRTHPRFIKIIEKLKSSNA